MTRTHPRGSRERNGRTVTTFRAPHLQASDFISSYYCPRPLSLTHNANRNPVHRLTSSTSPWCSSWPLSNRGRHRARRGALSRPRRQPHHPREGSPTPAPHPRRPVSLRRAVHTGSSRPDIKIVVNNKTVLILEYKRA